MTNVSPVHTQVSIGVGTMWGGGGGGGGGAGGGASSPTRPPDLWALCVLSTLS